MIAIPGCWCFEVGLSILRIDLETLVACGTGHWPVVLVHKVRGWYSGVELKMSRRQGGPSRTVAEEGVDLNRYLTNPAAAGQPPDSLAPYQSGYGPSPYRFAQPAVQPCAARY
jgi:hypothetical protein